MSLETEIKSLTLAIAALTDVLMKAQNVSGAVTTTQQVAPAAPVVVPPVPGMPELPSFATPLPSVEPVPFTDAKGLMDFTMAKYKALGAEKGALIKDVLATLGVKNVNEIKPEQYQAYYNGLQALGA